MRNLTRTALRAGLVLSLIAVLLPGCLTWNVQNQTRRLGHPRREFVDSARESYAPDCEVFAGVLAETVVRDSTTYNRFLFPGMLAGDPKRKLEVWVSAEGDPDTAVVRVTESSEDLPAAAPPAALLITLNWGNIGPESERSTEHAEIIRLLGIWRPDYDDESHREEHVIYLSMFMDGAEGLHRGPRPGSGPGRWRRLRGPRDDLEWIVRNRFEHLLAHALYLLSVPTDAALLPLEVLWLTFFFKT